MKLISTLVGLIWILGEDWTIAIIFTVFAIAVIAVGIFALTVVQGVYKDRVKKYRK